jgi:hypothetical protein
MSPARRPRKSLSKVDDGGERCRFPATETARTFPPQGILLAETGGGA